jgi:3-hydroxyacyl-CoA dehydrogenase/3-hydroxy-2-methylbutyryl-CoA dehydrogenase
VNLPGKAALVTGGASGLGRATAEELHRAGANVLIADLADRGDAAAAELGDRAAFIRTDVTSPDDVSAAIAAAVERFGGLHVVVNCAGLAWAARTLGREGPHDLEAFARVVQVNLIGTFNVIRLAAQQMAVQDPDGEERGVIVNTASVAAFDGQKGQVAYAASKGGVVGLTLPVARDLASLQIRVMTIAPGVFDTPMMAMLPEPARQQLSALVPHPSRLGRPEEYALMVRQIVENPMLNGTTIRLDGALRMP